MELNKDNPQERLFGWVAGIVDGEGCISIQKSLHKKANRITLVPYICIVNTDVSILNKCAEFCIKQNIAYRIYYRDSARGKPVYQMRIDGSKPVERFLGLLQDYLIGKKNQSILVREYIKQRQNKYLARNKIGQIKRRPYDDIDFGYYDKIKFLHHEVSSETIRFPKLPRLEDIVRPLEKSKESDGNARVVERQ